MLRQMRLLVLLLVTGVITVAALEYSLPHAGSYSPQTAAAAVAGDFGATLAWVIAGGYLLLFAAMVVEGPT